MDEATANTSSARNSRSWGTILVVLIIVVGGYFLLAGTREEVTQIAPGQEFVSAHGDRVVSNFPREFLIENGAAIESSYSLNYTDEGVEQPVVQYASNLNIAENIQAFRDMLASNQWQIVRDETNIEALLDRTTIPYIYAVKDNAEVNITFIVNDEGEVMVHIAYVEV